MQSPYSITTAVFRMKFFKLFFLAALSATMLTGCEKQPTLPIDPIDPPPTNTQLTQIALSELADTAAERKFVDLANAARDVAEILASDDGTSVQPTFSKLAELADKITILEQAYVNAGCVIALQKFAKTSMDAVQAWTIRDPTDMEQALLHLAQEASAAKTALHKLPTDNDFIPFAFGYGVADSTVPYTVDLPYELGVILVQYDNTIRPINETSTAMVEFLSDKGYKVGAEGVLIDIGIIYLNAAVDPLLIMKELLTIPGVMHVQPNILYELSEAIPPPPPSIIDLVRTRYNEAWCQGNFDVIDTILTEESGLDFFDYAFVRNLANIYAEEIPETAERIRMNRFSLRSIANEFLEGHSHNPEKTHDELIERFRQSVRDGNVGIEHVTLVNYYLVTDYWKQLVDDHINQ